MPKLIPGTELDANQRQSIFDSFRFRWTFENELRARQLYEAHGGPPDIEMITDDEWLRLYSFWFNKDGRMTGLKSAEYTPTDKEPWRATT